MVTNSLGEEKFHAANEKAPQHALKVPCLFPFQLRGGNGGGFFFHFSLVPNVFPFVAFKFPMCSQTYSP